MVSRLPAPPCCCRSDSRARRHSPPIRANATDEPIKRRINLRRRVVGRVNGMIFGNDSDVLATIAGREIRWHSRVLAVDLLNPSPAAEAKKHKLKMLVPAPRSFFMDVKCPGCFTITTVFSHAQTVVICQGCTTVLCQPTGGKARLTEGCSFRRK
ncbi:uncharacterized protein E0L32_010539 [Thyridium curvatum]|uniref:40S ribosomal protein S27 n=1 Tax=Thyridium curvatum TaxID=1093900 RepID=A0A507AL10_9PEZI|nr:uncharacterized protein E0L32_010539 [Thyridium curvatum]TPX07747.1 hypothetical protein E0L32_010539 [Thyridium curvatum]